MAVATAIHTATGVPVVSHSSRYRSTQAARSIAPHRTGIQAATGRGVARDARRRNLLVGGKTSTSGLRMPAELPIDRLHGTPVDPASDPTTYLPGGTETSISAATTAAGIKDRVTAGRVWIPVRRIGLANERASGRDLLPVLVAVRVGRAVAWSGTIRAEHGAINGQADIREVGAVPWVDDPVGVDDPAGAEVGDVSSDERGMNG